MDQNLQDYIKKSKKSGIADEQIRQELLKVGWSEDEVNKVFGSTIKQNFKNIWKKIFQVVISALVSIVFLTVSSVGIYYFLKFLIFIKINILIIFLGPPLVMLFLLILGLSLIRCHLPTIVKRLPFLMVISFWIALTGIYGIHWGDDVIEGVILIGIVISVLILFDPIQEKLFNYNYKIQEIQNFIGKIVVIAIIVVLFFSTSILSRLQIIDRKYNSNDLILFDRRECSSIPKNVYREKSDASLDLFGGGSGSVTYLRNECYYELAIEKKDFNLCEKINIEKVGLHSVIRPSSCRGHVSYEIEKQIK